MLLLIEYKLVFNKTHLRMFVIIFLFIGPLLKVHVKAGNEVQCQPFLILRITFLYFFLFNSLKNLQQ